MRAYEFKKNDESGCVWNFEDCEDNVLVWADSAEEAEEILQGLVDAAYEEEAATFTAYEIKDLAEYEENHYWKFWN